MAVDTAAKRSSAINPACPWRGRLPLPDATIAQGDRQAVALLYSGILAAGPAAMATTPGGAFTRSDTRRGFNRTQAARSFQRTDTRRGFKGGRNP